MSTTERAITSGFGPSPIVAAPTAGAKALIQREAQNIQVQMMVARNFPRDVLVSRDKIINAFTRPELCEEALYAYARGGSNISGLSIRAAEVLAQNWGNIRTGVTELSQENSRTELLAYAQDLETGFMDEKQFSVKHWRDTKGGGYAVTDERDIYEIGANFGARRKRACILAVIPKDIQDAAERQIEITLKTKAEVTDESIKALIDAFSKFGVTKEQIEKRIQRHIESMLPAQLVQMRRIFASLKDGMSEPSAWFEIAPPATDQTAGDGSPTSQFDAAKEAIRTAAAKNGATATDGKVPHFDKDTALAAIRETKALKDLEAVYAQIVTDFDSTKRPLPIEVEGAFGDRREALRQS